MRVSIYAHSAKMWYARLDFMKPIVWCMCICLSWTKKFASFDQSDLCSQFRKRIHFRCPIVFKNYYKNSTKFWDGDEKKFLNTLSLNQIDRWKFCTWFLKWIKIKCNVSVHQTKYMLWIPQSLPKLCNWIKSGKQHRSQ